MGLAERFTERTSHLWARHPTFCSFWKHMDSFGLEKARHVGDSHMLWNSSSRIGNRAVALSYHCAQHVQKYRFLSFSGPTKAALASSNAAQA